MTILFIPLALGKRQGNAFNFFPVFAGFCMSFLGHLLEMTHTKHHNPVLCNEFALEQRSCDTGHCRKLSTHRVTDQWLYWHVISASLRLEVALPSLAITPGQQECTSAAIAGIFLLDKANRAQITLIFLTCAKLINWLILLIICGKLSSCWAF